MQPQAVADAPLIPEGRAVDRHRGHDPGRRRPGIQAGGALGQEVAVGEDPRRHVTESDAGHPSPAAGIGRPGGVQDDDAHAVIRDRHRRRLEAEDRACARRRAVDCHGREHTRSDSRQEPAPARAATPPHRAMRRSSRARYRIDSCSHAASATIVAVRATAASRVVASSASRRSRTPSRPHRQARRCSRCLAGRSARPAAGASPRRACPSRRTRTPWWTGSGP